MTLPQCLLVLTLPAISLVPGCNRVNNVDQSVTNTNQTINNVTQVFGPEGGRMEGPGGTVLDLPPGAVTEEVEITIGEVVEGAPPLPPGIESTGTTFAFLPHGQTFALDVTITLPHNAGDGVEVRAYRADPDGLFSAVPTAQVTSETVVLRTPGFSFYETGTDGTPTGSTTGADTSDPTTDPSETDGTPTGSTTGADIPDPTTDASETDGGGSTGGTLFEPCDPWLQDCGPGEKCNPWANDGGGAWNANRCVPVDANPAGEGEACTVEGSGVSGIDSCDAGLMCQFVDNETLEGTCVALCGGTADSPSCDTVGTTCVVSNGGALNICLQECDPIVQDCAAGQGCFFYDPSAGEPPPPVDEAFVCFSYFDSGLGQVGDPCEFLSACQPGNICVEPQQVQSCGGVSGCCTEFCSVSSPVCSDGSAVCEPVMSNPAPGEEDIGACVLPT